jgi:hypothetical protein
MPTRRLFLEGCLGALGLALVTRGLRNEAAIDPRDFGAFGNGSADDTSAVQAAMARAFDARLPVDGGDLIFGIRGDLQVERRTNPWIRSLRLRQLHPSDSRKTVHFRGCEGIRIERLEIHVGQWAHVGYMNDSGGLWIDGGSNHLVDNVDVSGDGKNSLITIWNCHSSTFTNLRARNATFDDRNARDDVMQGIWLNASSDCVLQGPTVSNLAGNASFRGRSLPNLRTRGIVLSGTRDCSIIDARVQDVDQGIDVTGSDGNVGCVVLRGRAYQCASVGLKFANSAENCRASGFVTERCGAQGFIISGPGEPLAHYTANIELIGCVAIDTGYNHFPTTTAGFMIQAGTGASGSLVYYPQGIRLVRCRAIDTQARKSMDYGFYTNIVRGSQSDAPNILMRCESVGHKTAGHLGMWLVV